MSDELLNNFSFKESLDRYKFYTFISDSFRRVSLTYMTVLFVGVVLSTGVYFVTKNQTYAAIWPNQIVYYLLLIFHVFFRVRSDKANILSPDMLFLVFYTMFHLGYVTLYSLNIVPVSDYIFHYEQSIPRCMFVINLGLIGFLFGYEIIGFRSPALSMGPRITVPRPAWEVFGIILMIVAIGMHFAGLTLMGWNTVISVGYQVIGAPEKYTTSFLTIILLSFCGRLMAISISIYIIASVLRHGKMFHSKTALFLTIFYLTVSILEGERGSVVQFILPLLLVQHFFVKRIKTRYLILMFMGVLVLFAGLRLVRTIVFQPAKMLQEYQYQKQAGEIGWEYLFVEAGGSFLTVNLTTQDVPTSEPYWLGASWRDAAIHIVPYLQGMWVRSGHAKLAPAQWATYTYFGRDASGVGYTVAAEGYLNFGFPGAFIELMLLGMFIRWLMIYFGRKPSAMRAMIMLGCTVTAILTIRAEFNSLFSPCVRIIVLIWLLNMFLGNEPEPEANEYDFPETVLYE